MGKVSQLMMVKPTTKGFTIIESLFCIIIIMIMIFLALPYQHKIKIDVPFKEVMEVYYLQSEAMVSKEKKNYNDELTFNQNGNINHATTIHHNHYDLVFQLGNGRFYVRR